MSDTPNFLYSQNAEDFVEFVDDSDTPRAQIAPHFLEDDGVTLLIFPASRLVLGGIQDEDTGDEIATIRLKAAHSPGGLVYAFMPNEMRSLGEIMIKRADAIEAAAGKNAADVLSRIQKGDK